jgi:hypothetical protein
MALHDDFEWILENYSRTTKFSKNHPVYVRLKGISQQLASKPSIKNRPNLHIEGSVGQGNWARVPWIAFLDDRETNSTQRGVYPVYLFREDMTGFFMTFNQGVYKLKKKHGTPESRRILRVRAQQLREFCAGLQTLQFSLDDKIDLHASPGIAKDYEVSTVAYKFYAKGQVPSDQTLLQDVDKILEVYDKYLEKPMYRESVQPREASPEPTESNFEAQTAIQAVISYIEGRGFIYEPWQIAQYMTAIRTKPFAILAGITGTGKSKLPALIAEATGGESKLVPVRPDWTDSADVLGYTDLQGTFRPGSVLETAHEAGDNRDRFWTCIMDEMNLARVEQYFAEVLSRIEDRKPQAEGGYNTKALIGQVLREEDSEWGDVVIPPNLAIAGTVNMDESAHGFSRKVLDRAFTIELSDVELTLWDTPNNASSGQVVSTWPVTWWYPRAIMLREIADLSDQERAQINRVIVALTQVNQLLAPAQLQVGYRTRDEVALYLLHSYDISEAFVGRDGVKVDPLDLALQMKILPRIAGGSSAIRRSVLGMLGWANTGVPLTSDEEARPIIESWEHGSRLSSIANAKYPRLAARLCLMWERLESEGYTSYWL